MSAVYRVTDNRAAGPACHRFYSRLFVWIRHESQAVVPEGDIHIFNYQCFCFNYFLKFSLSSHSHVAEERRRLFTLNPVEAVVLISSRYLNQPAAQGSGQTSAKKSLILRAGRAGL